MLIKKADDYKSWYIEEDNFGILVDPWLDKKINPFSSFFLQRTREKSHVLTEKEINKVKTIVITAPFADHLHTPSLKSLSKEIDIVSNKFVGKLIRKYGIADSDILDYNEDLDFLKYDLIIDGIIGIGNSRKIDGKYRRAG